MHVWGLFDDGNSCYKQAVNEYNKSIGCNHTITTIGIGNADINLDLSSNTLHNKNALWAVLDTLRPPDVVLASPPCEAWSIASAIRGGNACWLQADIPQYDNMQNQKPRFIIRNQKDYDKYQYKYDKSFLTRINGEMCIFNTLKIIEKYNPKVYVIENPSYGKIWKYIANVIGFQVPYENLTYYNCYGYDVRKPTKFGSNIDLGLLHDNVKSTVGFHKFKGVGRNRANARSHIPTKLIYDILKACELYVS